MIVIFVPTSDSGTICVIGMLPGDLHLMGNKLAEPDTIDMRDAMNAGIALPTFVQIIYADSQEHFEERMKSWFASIGAEAHIVPLDQCESPFPKSEETGD